MQYCQECGRPLEIEEPVEQKGFDEATGRLTEGGAYIPNLLSAGFFEDAESLDLSAFDMCYSFEEGFSRPDWKLIGATVRKTFPEEKWPQAWREVGIKWLTQLCDDLGGGYRLYESQNFFLSSARTSDDGEVILRMGENAIQTIYRVVGPIARGKPVYGKHVLLVFEEEDDYYSYISYFHTEGEHSRSGGVFLGKGYYHIAFPFRDLRRTEYVVTHELTHNYLCYLRLPNWLNEGLCRRLESELTRTAHSTVFGSASVTARAPVLNADLAERHHSFWDERNIQEFWAGTIFYKPGEGNELAYSLGEVLVELLSESWKDFMMFVNEADYRDGGQDAALNYLGRSLGDVAGIFLGPGDWRPRRKAISDAWERQRQRTTGQSKPAGPGQ